jgi:hypothetical protein
MHLVSFSSCTTDSVLTLTAPKFPEEKKSVRSIAITSGGTSEQKQVGSGQEEEAA